jgi:hypothetical protein
VHDQIVDAGQYLVTALGSAGRILKGEKWLHAPRGSEVAEGNSATKITRDHLEWAVVDWLRRMLKGLPHEGFNVTQTYVPETKLGTIYPRRPFND